MKIRRKTNECPNCKALLDEVYNYCTICVQEHTDNTLSFNMLVADFFNTFFALDSKFAKSVKPFLFQPGFLTNQYLTGKRMTFAHPFRFYLIISLFFFFVFTIATKKSVEDSEDKEGGIVRTTYNLKNIDGLDEAEIVKLRNTLGKDRIKTIEQDMNGGKLINVQKALERNLTEKEKEELLAVLDSSALRALKFIPELTILDSLKNIETSPIDMLKVKPDTTSMKEDEPDDDVNINLDGEDHNIFKVLGMIDFEKMNELKNDLTITDNQIYDSLNLKNLTGFEEHVIRQLIRVNRTDETLFAEFIAKNLPLMMLLLIPIFAIVIKLLYIRRKHLYIMHLIHALHLHTFAYFLYGISLIAMLNIDDEDYASYIGIGAFLIVSTYAFISFLRVYKQGWFKTLVKFNLTGATYVTCIFVFFLVELVISFLLF